MSESNIMEAKAISSQNIISVPSTDEIKPRSSEGNTCGRMDGEDTMTSAFNPYGAGGAASGQNAASAL